MLDSVMVAKNARDRFVLACRHIVEQEAKKVVQRAPGCSFEELCSQGMLFLIEQAEGILAVASSPPALARYLLRQHLVQYMWEYGGVVRMPRTRGVAHAQAVSLDEPAGEDGLETWVDLLVGAGDQGVDAEYEDLCQALAELPEQERQAFLLRYLPAPGSTQRVRSWRVISKELGATVRETRDLVDAALVCLRYELTGRPVL